jgi:putative hydrolase of the HAD superfamily
LTGPGRVAAADGVAAVLFDVDETLYDRRLAQSLVLERMRTGLAHLLGRVDGEALERAWLESDRQTENHAFTWPDIRASRNRRSGIFLSLLGLPPEAADEVTQLYVATYAQVPAAVAGARQVVAACAARLPVGVVSNAFPDVQYRKLEAIGVRGLLRCVVLSEEFGARKPDPSIFLEGCRRLGMAPGRCLYVGDSFANDVVGARAAGLVPCWYNPQGLEPPAGQEPPALVLRALDDLPAALGWD